MSTFRTSRELVGYETATFPLDDATMTIAATLHHHYNEHKRTTRLEQAPQPYAVLTMDGEHTLNGRTAITSAGQIHHLLTDHPDQTISDLGKVWRRWHLNDMHAGSEEQAAVIPAGQSDPYQYMLDHPLHTDSQNYAYGTEWLLEPLPADVWPLITRLLETLNRRSSP